MRPGKQVKFRTKILNSNEDMFLAFLLLLLLDVINTFHVQHLLKSFKDHEHESSNHVPSSADITISADMLTHRPWLKFYHPIICISFSSLSGAAHACLFGDLGGSVIE